MLARLLKFRQGQKIELKEEEIKALCTAAKKICLEQPVRAPPSLRASRS